MSGRNSFKCKIPSHYIQCNQSGSDCECIIPMAYISAPDLNRELDSYIKNSLYGFAAATKMIEALGTNITGNSIADFLQENSPENTLALFFSVVTGLLQDQRAANSVASTLLNRNEEIKLALQNINSLDNSFLSYIASAKQNALKQNIQRVLEKNSTVVASSGSSSSGNTQRADRVAVLVQAIIDVISG